MIKKVTGNKKVLKSTQEYPAPFGAALRQSYDAWLSQQHSRCPIPDDPSESDYEETTDIWNDANLAPVLRKMSQQFPSAAKLL